MRRAVGTAAALALVWGWTAGSGVSVAATGDPARVATPRDRPYTVRPDIVYRTVDGVPLHVDAFLPHTAAKRRSTVLFVHGGGWVGGDRTSIEDEARWAAELGFVAFSVQYRLAPAHPFPAAVADVRAAVRWLREPAQVRAFRIDPRRIGALGSSAGGHLVGMLATTGRGTLAEGSRIRAGVSWSGPLDLTRESDTYSAVAGSPAVATFLQCGHRDAGCAARQRAASPVTHADPTDAPMLLVASEEELVPPDQAQAMAVTLARAGVPHRLVILPGAAHAQAYRESQWPDAVQFLERHLGTPTAPRA